MADQDYPNLYASMEASVVRVRDAALSYEKTIGGLETDTVPVYGYPPQPTIAKRVADRIDFLAETMESAAMQEINSLASATNYVSPEIEYLIIVDEEAAKIATLTQKRLQTLGFDVIADDKATMLMDGDGGVSFYSDIDRTITGPMEFQYTPQPGMFVTDRYGAVLMDLTQEADNDPAPAPSPFGAGLMFSPVIATSDLREYRLYMQNIMSSRALNDDLVASIGSTTTAFVNTGRSLPVVASKMGSTATLTFRSKESPNTRRSMAVAMKHVPVQSPTVAKNILMIGDSISNRQLTNFLKTYLAELGIVATFIGTLNTSNSSSNANDATGELAEAREGWETGDFTYAITDRVGIITPGDEAIYMAMSKTDKWPINPFLRVATGGDPVDVVCNGYVFDPAFYQSRFGLATPDIVINMLGTNDVRDRTAETIGGHVLSNDTIMHKQIRAAWPSAKIIRSVPGTPITSTRNMLWETRYLPMILAMKQSAAALAYSGLTVAPVWAMTDPENGYNYSNITPGSDGFITGSWSDEVHPTGSARQSLAIALAPFVAAAAINLI